jgi:hypothetical protein
MIFSKPYLHRPLLVCVAAGILSLISLYGAEVTAQSAPPGEEAGTILTGPPPPSPAPPNFPTKDFDMGGETVTLSPIPTDSSNPPPNMTISPSPHTQSFPLNKDRPPVTDGFSINLTIPLGPKP